MSEDRYQVLSEGVFAQTRDSQGLTWRLFEKGAIIPGGTENLKHLLECGYVVKVGDEATGGVDAAGVPSGAYDVRVPEGVTSTPVERTEEQRKADAEAAEKAAADAELESKREAARAKLPEDGSAPDGRAAQSVWVEYMVKTQDASYEDVKDATKADLIDLAKQQSR